MSPPTTSSFEYTTSELPGPYLHIVCTVYGPPKYKKNFIRDLSALLTNFSLLTPDILILDFNINFDNSNNSFSSVPDWTVLILNNILIFRYILKDTLFIFLPALVYLHLTSKWIYLLSLVTRPKSHIPCDLKFRNISKINPDSLLSAKNKLSPCSTLMFTDKLVSFYNFQLAPVKH